MKEFIIFENYKDRADSPREKAKAFNNVQSRLIIDDISMISMFREYPKKNSTQVYSDRFLAYVDGMGNFMIKGNFNDFKRMKKQDEQKRKHKSIKGFRK